MGDIPVGNYFNKNYRYRLPTAIRAGIYGRYSVVGPPGERSCAPKLSPYYPYYSFVDYDVQDRDRVYYWSDRGIVYGFSDPVRDVRAPDKDI